MPIRPFAKGHDAAALGRALAITDQAARQAAINAVPLYGARKLANPQYGLGAPPSGAPIPPPPEDESLETAEELAEVAGMILLADTPIGGIGDNLIARRLCDTLLALGGRCLVELRPGGLFRLNANRMGGRLAPLLDDTYPTGWNAPGPFQPIHRTGTYGATEMAFAALQQGRVIETQTFGQAAPITTLRGWASFCHSDPPISIPDLVGRQLLALGVPFSSRFPSRPKEAGFASYGGAAWLANTIPAAVTSALEECWRIKWLYRRQRPEELWPRACRGELHPNFLQYAGWLVEALGPRLPMLVCEGSPMHPDYLSGHAVIAGAGFTVLKAAFADSSFSGMPLHRMLDLIALIMSAGRQALGIHSRSSVIQGLLLGEWHALRILEAQAARSTEQLGAVTFQGFSGLPVTVPGN